MEQIIETIISFLNQWGFWELVAIVLIVILTCVLKIPIYKAAVKYQEKHGVDKSFITWVISVIPFVLAFVFALILHLWSQNWNVAIVVWSVVIKNTTALGAGAIGIFELIKKFVQAATAKKIYNKEVSAVQSATGATKVEAQVRVIKINSGPDESKKEVKRKL